MSEYGPPWEATMRRRKLVLLPVGLLLVLAALVLRSAGVDAQSAPRVFGPGSGEAPPPSRVVAPSEVTRSRSVRGTGADIVDALFVNPDSYSPGPGQRVAAEVRSVEAELFDGQCVTVTATEGSATRGVQTAPEGAPQVSRPFLEYHGVIRGPDGSTFGSLGVSAIPSDGSYGIAGDGTYHISAHLSNADALYTVATADDGSGRIGLYQQTSAEPPPATLHPCAGDPVITTSTLGELPRTQ